MVLLRVHFGLTDICCSPSLFSQSPDPCLANLSLNLLFVSSFNTVLVTPVFITPLQFVWFTTKLHSHFVSLWLALSVNVVQCCCVNTFFFLAGASSLKTSSTKSVGSFFFPSSLNGLLAREPVYLPSCIPESVPLPVFFFWLFSPQHTLAKCPLHLHLIHWVPFNWQVEPSCHEAIQ